VLPDQTLKIDQSFVAGLAPITATEPSCAP
jgi:hypothetical protein